MTNKPSQKRLLFLCAGLGKGNASRTLAIIEAIARQQTQSLTFNVFTWGAGGNFLSTALSSLPISVDLQVGRDYIFRDESHSVASRAYQFGSSFLLNSVSIHDLVKKLRPDLIIIDSDYHLPGYLFRSLPVISINQARDVVTRASEIGYQSQAWRDRFTFIVRENLDALFQETFSGEVICPSFMVGREKIGRVEKIPLIVRQEFLDEPGAPISTNSTFEERYAVLSGGSGFERELLAEFGQRLNAPLIGFDQNQDVVKARDLKGFTTLITQGGLSSLSEGIALGKFVAALPIRHHPEQEINAKTLEAKGLGICLSPTDLDQIEGLKEKIRARRKMSQVTLGERKSMCEGAAACAKIILNRLNLRDH